VAQRNRYPRTTVEISDAVLSVLREGLKLRFHRNYPDIICYNGRERVKDSSQLSIYYIRTRFEALMFEPVADFEEYDIRMVIVRDENKSVRHGLPVFWCSVWYRKGDEELHTLLQDHTIHRAHYLVWDGEGYCSNVIPFDPSSNFPELDMLREGGPPPPVGFTY
jgi:hypothetical protein